VQPTIVPLRLLRVLRLHNCRPTTAHISRHDPKAQCHRASVTRTRHHGNRRRGRCPTEDLVNLRVDRALAGRAGLRDDRPRGRLRL